MSGTAGREERERESQGELVKMWPARLANTEPAARSSCMCADCAAATAVIAQVTGAELIAQPSAVSIVAYHSVYWRHAIIVGGPPIAEPQETPSTETAELRCCSGCGRKYMSSALHICIAYLHCIFAAACRAVRGSTP
jgi:hypothetical protein